MSDERHVTNEPTPFVTVPEALAYDPTLSDKAFRLYVVLRRHGDDPSNCYPSKRRLADLMGCSPSSLGRPLRELEDAGWIERVPRRSDSGDPDSNGYHVRSARQSSAGSAQENAYPPRTGAVTPRAGERAKREPLNESQGTENARASAAPLQLVSDEAPVVVHAFDAFWKAYPRKVAKPEARKAWDAKVKTAADGAAVLNGLDAWAAYWRARGEERFIPHPSTWLRREGWNDTPPAEPRAQPRGPRWVSTPEEEQAERSRATGRVSDEELWG